MHLTVVRSITSRIRTCVKSSGCISQCWSFTRSVVSLVFLHYMSMTLKMSSLKKGNTPTELQLLSFYLLMYADDMVLFS